MKPSDTLHTASATATATATADRACAPAVATGRTLAKALTVLATVALVAGCAAPKDRYYTLAAPTVAAAPPPVTPLFIEMAPVALPERLARPQMLVRKNAPGAEVRLLEQHRWASSFENELRDALAAGVAGRTGAVDVTKGGRQGSAPAWRIAVQVRQFDAVEDDRVEAAMSWTLRRADRDASLSCQWSASEKVDTGIDALARGAQRVAQRAADAIGDQVLALQASPSAVCIR
ncbi:hypothetical protein GN316_03615 [Xylophilus sp. Kf1]|nr:hypothetical protein [Xylophilus sp. Kf1]